MKQVESWDYCPKVQEEDQTGKCAVKADLSLSEHIHTPLISPFVHSQLDMHNGVLIVLD